MDNIIFPEDLQPGAKWLNPDHIPPSSQFEYAIIPVTFANYDEYVNCLNDFGKEGWIFLQMIQIYHDAHPLKGVITHDWVCCRQKVKIES